MPLDATDPTWINAPGGVGPAYDAEELRRDMGYLLTGGSAADVSRTGVLDLRALTVKLSGSNVQVNPGGAAIGTSRGAYLTGAAATATVDALAPADVTNPRRDRVVLEVLDPDNGGGAGRKAQFRVITGAPSATAASGGGYPAAPSSPSITLAHVDVPKSGAGSPVVTDRRPFTGTSGSPIPVASKDDADALPKWAGAARQRLDLGGIVEVCDGATWSRGIIRAEFIGEIGVQKDKPFGPGPLTKNSSTINGGEMSSPGNDLITLPGGAEYAIHIRARIDAPAAGTTFLSLRWNDDQAVASEIDSADILPGKATATISVPNLYVPATRTLKIYFTTGAPEGTILTTRARITRIG